MSSIQKVLSSELDWSSYVTELNLNPDNVFYQSVSARNISTSNAQWTITSPNKRSVLLAWAVVNWQPTIRRLRADGSTAENWGASMNYVSYKPVMPYANAMSSITLSVNGNTITLSQPRRFIEGITCANVTKAEADTCFESTYPDSMGGRWCSVNPGNEEVSTVDDRFLKNEYSWQEKLFKAQGVDQFGAFNNVAMTGNEGCQEPLIVPPFNPFAKLKAGMPDYMWFKHMSNVIPNIDRLELDIQFQNLTPSVLYPRFVNPTANTTEDKLLSITNLAADLKLYWYELPVNMSLPPQIDLQTWSVREFQSSIAQVANGTAFARVTSDLIQLNSTPTLIQIAIQRDKDDALYNGTFAARSETFGSDAIPYVVTNPSVANGGNNSWDSYGEITNVEILLGDRPNVISTNFTKRELYYLTQKNSKLPYPYDYENWTSHHRYVGDSNGRPNVGTDQVVQASKCVILLRPKDIAEKISDGVFAPNSFQIRVNGIARDGTHAYGGNTQNYRLYIHLYYGKHFLRQSPDRSQYQEQSIPLDVARQLTNPVLQSQGVTGDGGALNGIRLRADGGYTSRVGSR